MSYQNFEIVAHATRLYQAGMEGELRQYIKKIDSAQQAGNVISWLNQLVLNAENSIDNNLPVAVSARSSGWVAYFSGEYIQAFEGFKLSLTHQDWESVAYDTALGMAKVYTRSGHWQLAKDWTLYHLSLARKLRDDYGLVKGYGALAEIFLRADRPKEALACFQIANQMMPSGQGQLDKQYNFIASALIRNGEYLRAETLLRNSMKLSKDKMTRDTNNRAAKISYLHSCSRLSYLKLAQNKPINLTEDMLQVLSEVKARSARVPTGFIRVAQMIEATRSNEASTALFYLHQAAEMFAECAPMELKWVERLQVQLAQESHLEVTPEMDLDTDMAQQLMTIEPISPPKHEVTVDLTWHQVTLTNQGYKQIQQGDVPLSELVELWRLFFI